jgi:3-oxoacyl-(acyl-carrier-protein) synthase
VRGEGRRLDPDYLVSNSFGFGGINAALVFRKADA